MTATLVTRVGKLELQRAAGSRTADFDRLSFSNAISAPNRRWWRRSAEMYVQRRLDAERSKAITEEL